MFMHPTTCVQRHTPLNPLVYGISLQIGRDYPFRPLLPCHQYQNLLAFNGVARVGVMNRFEP